MTELNFIYTIPFLSAWEKLGYSDKDQIDLETEIISFFENRPANSHGKIFPGMIIEGTNGAYKLRFSSSNSNTGKSGSSRIIYCIVTNQTLAFLDIYPKSKKESLSAKEKKAISRIIEILKKKELKND